MSLTDVPLVHLDDSKLRPSANQLDEIMKRYA